MLLLGWLSGRGARYLKWQQLLCHGTTSYRFPTHGRDSSICKEIHSPETPLQKPSPDFSAVELSGKIVTIRD